MLGVKSDAAAFLSVLLNDVLGWCWKARRGRGNDSTGEVCRQHARNNIPDS